MNIQWLHDVLLAFAPGALMGTWLGSRLTRAKDEQQWRRDRRLEAYADVLRGCQRLDREASQLFHDDADECTDDYTAQSRVVKENVLQLRDALNRTSLLATPEMRDMCNELSATFSRRVSQAGLRPREMGLGAWLLAGDKADALVKKFTVQAQNDLVGGSRMKPTKRAFWRLIQRWR